MAGATGLAGLLDGEPAVVTAGLQRFHDTLAAQGVAADQVDWRPPVEGTRDALAAVATDRRVPEANAMAVGRLLGARPHVVDITTAREALGLDDRTLLHAGPPLDWERASGPIRGAVIGALLYEGAASSPEEAERLAASGGLRLEPCHHHRSVGPMAGIVSPSMPMWVVHDEGGDGTAYCTLNEGLGKVLRYGAFGDDVLDRLRWMERVVAPVLGEALRRHGPLDVRSLLSQALHMGDEAHNRLRATTSLLLRELAASLVQVEAPSSDVADVIRFIVGNDHFALNIVMPSAKVSADAARDVPGSTLVVAMARNGTDFGIQVSGTGDRWFTAPALMPEGLMLGSYTLDDANPDIGDSTITETVGLGGFALAAGPAIVRFVGGDVREAITRNLTMYEITLTEHDVYQVPILEFRGSATGIDVTRVVRTHILPSITTGIAGRQPGVGQVGAGLVTPPMECFVAAVGALAAESGGVT